MSRLLLISRDPGGTNPLVALRHFLLGADGSYKSRLCEQLALDGDLDIMILAKDYAQAVWRNQGIAAEPWPDSLAAPDIGAYLADFSPDRIITGTAHVDDHTEQNIWQAARIIGVPTMAFLDSAAHVALRFTNSAGQRVWPDRLAVLDPTQIIPLQAVGFDPDSVIVTGDLFGDFLRTQSTDHQPARPDDVRVVLFASDYIQEMQALGVEFAVTEFEALDCLMALLAQNSLDLAPPYRLIIRPHPKDRPGKYDAYQTVPHQLSALEIDNSAPARTAILSVHLVAGISSSLLQEAESLGVPILRLSPLVQAHKARPENL